MQNNEPSDFEFAVQLIKILLLLMFGLGFTIIGVHINHNITTLISQQAEMIKKLK